jgi:hypothetical protein
MRPWLPARSGAGVSISAQDFDRYGPVEMSIEGLVDHPHAALAEFCFNPVVAQRLADHGVHIRTSLSC